MLRSQRQRQGWGQAARGSLGAGEFLPLQAQPLQHPGDTELAPTSCMEAAPPSWADSFSSTPTKDGPEASYRNT